MIPQHISRSIANLTKQKLVLSLLIFPLILGCADNNSSDQENNVIEIDLNESEAGLFSDIFENPQYILLDFTDDKPLINPYNITFKDGLIFIRDNRVNNLFIFEESGNIKNIIESKGRGPGEFFQIDDFQVTNNRIYIQDTYLRKQLAFNREGQFIEEMPNRYNNTNFYIGGEYSLYFLSYQTDYDNFNFIRKNNFNGKEDRFHKIPNLLENMIRSDNLMGIKEHPFQDILYFSLPHSTQVIFIDKTTGLLDEIYNFDFGKHNFSDSKRKAERTELARLIREHNLVRDIGLFHPYSNKNLLYVNQGLDKKHYVFMDNEFNVVSQKVNMKNDLDGMPYIFPWAASGNELIFRFNSKEFYNKYLEIYTGKSVKVEEGNIHDFFKNNANNLKEDKWVLVKLSIK